MTGTTVTPYDRNSSRGIPVLVAKARRAVIWLVRPSFSQLFLRVAIAVPFWKSGILKWDGFFRLNDTAITLFTDEFRLHLPGGPYAFPMPAVFAFCSACGELFFPVLLILGLGTRFAAIGILCMTFVIELTEPDAWPIHLTWAAIALGIAAWGPGKMSIDYLLGDRSPRSS